MSAEQTIAERFLAPADDHRAMDSLAPTEFEAVVRTHQRQIYRILWLQLHDSDAAETLTQECFLRAYRKWHEFRGESSVGTWLIRIALNLARDHVRSRRLAFWRRLRWATPATTSASAVPDRDPSPERQLLARERLNTVWDRVDRLPVRQRTCFMLRYVEEMPIAAIAETLELEVGTVKAHLARALGAVRQHMQEQEQP